MPSTVWKYPLKGTGEQTIEMPSGSRILHIAMQHNRVRLWALVDPEMPMVGRVLRIYGTGHEMPDVPGFYWGTFMVDDGDFVFHVFEPQD